MSVKDKISCRNAQKRFRQRQKVPNLTCTLLSYELLYIKLLWSQLILRERVFSVLEQLIRIWVD